MARLLLKRPSPFAFPGSLPGFDPSHPASKGCLFSGIPAPDGGFSNLLTGAGGTKSGTPTLAMTGYGPALKSVGNTDNDNFPYPAVAWPAQTMAVIVRFDTLGASVQVIQATAAGGSSGFYIANAGTGSSSQWAIVVGVTFVIISGLPAPIAGATYFVVVSVQSATNYNIVVRRLDNGQVWAVTATTALSFIAGDTTLYIGNRGTNARQTLGAIMATMHNINYMTLPQMVQWAQDPWSFWYPQTFDLLQAVTIPSLAGYIPYNPWPQAAPLLAS